MTSAAGPGPELRDAVVAALVRLAGSERYQDRADAGAGLALLLDRPQAAETAQALVLDGRDTFVTVQTAEALLRRGDVEGVRVVARALTSADDSHGNWIGAAVHGVLGIRQDELVAAQAACAQLLGDVAEGDRAGVRRLGALLSEVRPVLRREP